MKLMVEIQGEIAKPLFDVVLVNYKSYELTTICLNLLQQIVKDGSVQVWVVDNDSKDESTEYLRSLDWINLIERKCILNEPGYMAHGRALDLVMEKVSADYLFIMHTDTLIYDLNIFDLMMDECAKNKDIIAVGCIDQVSRGWLRVIWRFVTRFLKYYFRKAKLTLGLKTRAPRPYYEVYLKSFFALWNVKVMKEEGVTFTLNDILPSYGAQDELLKVGYKLAQIPSRKIFSYLDHMEAGTIAAQGGYSNDHQRAKKYKSLLAKMSES